MAQNMNMVYTRGYPKNGFGAPVCLTMTRTQYKAYAKGCKNIDETMDYIGSVENVRGVVTEIQIED